MKVTTIQVFGGITGSMSRKVMRFIFTVVKCLIHSKKEPQNPEAAQDFSLLCLCAIHYKFKMNGLTNL